MFARVNQFASDKSNIIPMANYFGKKPDPEKDPYDRRITQQLNDIDFSEDEEDDFEDIRNIKRMPRTVLNEENLKKYLSHETLRLNLEHHYWLKSSLLGKLGRMAPNLKVLCLRRLKITNEAFEEIFEHLKTLERLDISYSPFINKKGMLKFLESCSETVQAI